MHPNRSILIAPALLGLALPLRAGPYSGSSNDPSNPHDAPVPGFVGPHGPGMARLLTSSDPENPVYENPENYVNPVFAAWAETVESYQPSAFISPQFADESYGLGKVTGDNFDVVSLGDLTATQISQGVEAGSITLSFARPILNMSGADFVIFENGHLTESNQGGAGIGGIFAELAYVEVSDGGGTYVRFPATSLTPASVGAYGSLDPTGVHHLAGKHLNAFGKSWGTPFDLSAIGLTRITHIRLVDVPGSGAFTDTTGNPIYDAWTTFGSGGFDLEAIGAISTPMSYAEWPQLEILEPGDRAPSADPDADGRTNFSEYAFGTLPWKADVASHTIVRSAAGTEFIFNRDERLDDLLYEVQASSDMTGWTTIASGNAGAPIQGANGHTPVITESSADPIQSIGVIRRVSVRETTPGGIRFFRVKAVATSVSIPGE